MPIVKNPHLQPPRGNSGSVLLALEIRSNPNKESGINV